MIRSSRFTIRSYRFTIQTQGREAGERRGRGRARGETDIGRREGAQKQGRAWGHRHRAGEGGEGSSRFSVHGSRFTIRRSRFTIRS